jgi:hypothetical protein
MTTKIEIFASCRPNGLTRFLYFPCSPLEQDLHLFEACIESFSNPHSTDRGEQGIFYLGFVIWATMGILNNAVVNDHKN